MLHYGGNIFNHKRRHPEDDNDTLPSCQLAHIIWPEILLWSSSGESCPRKNHLGRRAFFKELNKRYKNENEESRVISCHFIGLTASEGMSQGVAWLVCPTGLAHGKDRAPRDFSGNAAKLSMKIVLL